MATRPLKNFPDPESIRGMAQGLGVTVTDIVMASARSLGLPVYTGNDPSALSIGGAGNLDDSAKEALATVAREFIRLTSQREDGADHGTSTSQEQEPRTEAGGTKHRSSSGSDRGRSGAPMKRGKVARLARKNHGTDLDPSSGPGAVHVAGDRMPPPDQLRPEDILAAHTSDDPSGMYPDYEGEA